MLKLWLKSESRLSGTLARNLFVNLLSKVSLLAKFSELISTSLTWFFKISIELKKCSLKEIQFTLFIFLLDDPAADK